MQVCVNVLAVCPLEWKLTIQILHISCLFTSSPISKYCSHLRSNFWVRRQIIFTKRELSFNRLKYKIIIKFLKHLMSIISTVMIKGFLTDKTNCQKELIQVQVMFNVSLFADCLYTYFSDENLILFSLVRIENLIMKLLDNMIM
jgi:hypothetical protein